MPPSPSLASSTFHPAALSHAAIKVRIPSSSSITRTVFIARPGPDAFTFGSKRQALNRSNPGIAFAPPGRYSALMRGFKLLPVVLVLSASALGGEAATGRIIKVLPHLLDREGRHALSPSLYERDAYQAFLRKNPDQCSGLRFDVQCKAKAADWSRLRLRMEVRGSKEAKPLVLEQPVRRNPRYHRWSSLTLDGASYQKAGELIAWRATLWEGDKMLAQQKSFLW